MIDIGFNVFDGFYMGITFLLSLGSIFITTLALVSMFPAIELERRKGVLAKKLDDLCDCVFYTPTDIDEYKRNREKILLILSDYQYNFELYQQDVLKIDLKHLIKKEKENTNIKKVKIVANLPYYITTPIIMKLLEEKLDLESITVMIQKEVADRLIAIPGEKETGAITYAVYYYAIAEAILEVPKESFIPEPEVTSKVIKLNIRKEPPIEVQDKELMFKIIKSAFMQRRKTLINALNNAKIFQNKEEGNQILESLKLDESVRAEKLTLENFADITNRILKKGI